MKKPLHVITLVIVGVTVLLSPSAAQELEKIRIGSVFWFWGCSGLASKMDLGHFIRGS
jgi:hypothetical protein